MEFKEDNHKILHSHFEDKLTICTPIFIQNNWRSAIESFGIKWWKKINNSFSFESSSSEWMDYIIFEKQFNGSNDMQLN